MTTTGSYKKKHSDNLFISTKQHWADKKVLSIFASSHIRLKGILIMRWVKMQQCWNDANAKDATYHDITDPKFHVF